MGYLPIILFKALLMAFPLTGPGDESVPNYKEGLVIDAGSTEEGGCGWLLSIEGRNFKPKNLADAHQKDSLKVKLDIDYSMTLYRCESMEEDMQEVIINWIEPE